MEEENELCLIYFSFSLLKAWFLSRCAISFSRLYISWATVCTSIFRFFLSSFLLQFDVCSQSHGMAQERIVQWNDVGMRRWLWWHTITITITTLIAPNLFHGCLPMAAIKRNGRVLLLHIGVNNNNEIARTQLNTWRASIPGVRSSTAEQPAFISAPQLTHTHAIAQNINFYPFLIWICWFFSSLLFHFFCLPISFLPICTVNCDVI